ncbi:MAG: hypothetical protein EXS16_20760 [Gemmataceae bacterium]|nr:hypothetical protein [Gemmataceae bacterium]
MTLILGPFSLDRVVRAVELVRQRLLRATAALEGAGLPYAVAGGNAVALWVSRVDPGAVRNTSDVDLLVRRSDLDGIKGALAAAGFEYRHASGLDLFLDGPGGRARDGIHLIFAGEMVRPGEALPNPEVTDSEAGGEFRVLQLRALVGVKLTAYRDKDRTHLRDMLEVGLIDGTWGQHYPVELADRLRALVETPGG